MASFTDTTKHVARQAKARQPKLHLDTGAEALRALGFQLGENIKMATGARARILGAVIPDHQADYKEHARLWVEKVEKRGATAKAKTDRAIANSSLALAKLEKLQQPAAAAARQSGSGRASSGRGASPSSRATSPTGSMGSSMFGVRASGHSLGSAHEDDSNTTLLKDLSQGTSTTVLARHAVSIDNPLDDEDAHLRNLKAVTSAGFRRDEVVYSSPLGLRATVLGESTGMLQLDGTTTYPTWLQYDTGRTHGSAQEQEQRERAGQQGHPCVVRGPMEPVVQYAHETSLERARREVEGEPPRVEPPFWGNRCAPAHWRNTCGGLCAPTRCACASHGPRAKQQLVQPSWWGPSDALLERLQRSEQSERNPHMPLSVLAKPVPPAMGVGREASETRRISGTASRYTYMRRGIATSAAEQRPRTEALTPPAPKVKASLTQQLWGDQLAGVKIGMMI